MAECIKVIGGTCAGCETRNYCANMIENGVPYQEVLEYVKKLYCKEGQLPTIEIEKDIKDQRITGIILEGEKLAWKRKKL